MARGVAVAAVAMVAMVAVAAGAEAPDGILTLNNPQYAHCFLVRVLDGTGWDNPFMSAHRYQYQPPQWTPGDCPEEYNYFNRNVTLAPGVELTVLGVNNATATDAEAAAAAYAAVARAGKALRGGV
eukprot:CAMPEP_0203819792 /NCGR_PEP_ID=MMETSP0115-20131106/37472_1 /ASSEMBLY_ACC=CAM_ASM_000227 /TAXON_ID=33651 /ORGANISM="Bicosoecid sp, Strain ms1" /LENGTH=125 /DNA_ID=CAMNT_0050728781 /DNA_START=112 /DNA_END=489 /DNA_ORIENTATION=+